MTTINNIASALNIDGKAPVAHPISGYVYKGYGPRG